MAQNKYKLEVDNCECKKAEMHLVCELRYLFRVGVNSFGFWFDSPEERDTAQANIAAAFPAATFETLDPEVVEPVAEPVEPDVPAEPEPEPAIELEPEPTEEQNV